MLGGKPNASAGTAPSRTTDGPMTYLVTGVDGVVFEANHGRILEGKRAEARIYYLTAAKDTKGKSMWAGHP